MAEKMKICFVANLSQITIAIGIKQNENIDVS